MHLCYTVKGMQAVCQARLDSRIGNYLSTTLLSSQRAGTYLSACKHFLECTSNCVIDQLCLVMNWEAQFATI